MISWNISGNRERWADLGDDVDIALLQEAINPGETVKYQVCPAFDGAWRTTGWTGNAWQRTTAIAAPSRRYQLRPYPLGLLDGLVNGGLAVGRAGSLAVADVLLGDEVVLTVASAYAFWQRGHLNRDVEFADASAHTILSELSPLILGRLEHRIVLAGDFNILYGYSEGENLDRPYWEARYASVFTRAESLGLRYKGPHAPNARRAEPPPAELPRASLCVPTYHGKQGSPASAYRQLDHVFVSESIADNVIVSALNELQVWGGSDHCRIEIAASI